MKAGIFRALYTHDVSRNVRLLKYLLILASFSACLTFVAADGGGLLFVTGAVMTLSIGAVALHRIGRLCMSLTQHLRAAPYHRG